MSLAPIVLFVYNRPLHTERTLNALMQNQLADESVLYVYADGPKATASKEDIEKIEKTRAVVKTKQWCKEIHIVEFEKNKGLANSVIDGVTELVNRHGNVIVLEDDLITAKCFLKFMNTALDKYEKEEIVWQVSGYFFPINKIRKKHSCFFLPVATSWGWGTWKRAWNKFDESADGYQKLRHHSLANQFDLDGSYPYSKMLLHQMENKTIDSWAIRWWWCMFKEKALTLFPDFSLVINIGYGLEGTHTHGTDPYLINNFNNDYFIKSFPEYIKASETNFKYVTFFLRTANNHKGHSKLAMEITKMKKLALSLRNKISYKGVS